MTISDSLNRHWVGLKGRTKYIFHNF